jgi:hypothetical protein
MGRATRPRLPYRPPQAQRHHYVFLRPCGCPEGLTEASARKPGGPPRIADEDAAWDAMYTRAEERDARNRGITVVHVDHATYERDYYPLMNGPCPHQPPAVVDVHLPR